MKKKLLSALIAGGIAAVGVAGSLSTAIALYYIGAEPINMDISIQTSSDATLAIDYTAPEATTLVFNPATEAINIPYKIRGQKTDESTYTQPFIVGKLEVTITSTSEDFLNMITPTNVLGYTVEGYYKGTHSNMKFGDVTGSENSYSITGTMMATSPVADSADNALEVNLALTKNGGVTAADVAAVSGATYGVSIAYTNPTDEEYYEYFGTDRAYVVGIDGVWSNQSDEFMMVPNILSSNEFGIEYMWIAPKDYGEVQFKANRNGMKEPSGTKVLIWSAGDNLVATVSAGDTVYWNGYFTNTVDDAVKLDKLA